LPLLLPLLLLISITDGVELKGDENVPGINESFDDFDVFKELFELDECNFL
jgi:hypothetical protein